MATLEELHDLQTNVNLEKKIASAITIKAHAFLALPTPTDSQAIWSHEALRDPISKAKQIQKYVLADNSGASVAQITGASDAQIQTAVNAAADKLAVPAVIASVGP